MLDLVDVGESSLDSYAGVAPDDLLEAVSRTAQALRGARVLHVNATPYGGGVSELLRSVVPLLNDQGLRADWRIISGDEPFFQVTKAIHNGLQGAEVQLSDADKARYLATSRANAAGFDLDYDFIFIHDPQPAALLGFTGKGRARWIWRSHIDTANANPEVWSFLRPFLAEYDASIFTMAEFVPADLPTRVVEIIPPAIDPRNPKNLGLPETTARQVLEWIGVRTELPLVTQVSRFDPWKDPLGVIEACRLARHEVPDLQLALVGSMASDDPEGWDMYRAIRSAIAGDKHMHVFTNLVGVGNIEVNAFQALSKVVIQKSLREGFGLVVAEALWKGTPVVAGRTRRHPAADGRRDGRHPGRQRRGVRARDGHPAARRGARAGAGRQRPRARAAPLPHPAPRPRRALAHAAHGRRRPRRPSVRVGLAPRSGLRHGRRGGRGDHHPRRPDAQVLLVPVPRDLRSRA